MQDILLFVFYGFVVSLPTVCATYLAAIGNGNWGWFLIMSALILLVVKYHFKT